jgi:hypothetical protein
MEAAFRRSWCQLFADIGCHMVSVTDPYGRILDFLDRSLLLLSNRNVAMPTPDGLSVKAINLKIEYKFRQ